ncbi:MAG: TlyA family RNA methyltransferase [Rhodospirillales bacterium]
MNGGRRLDQALVDRGLAPSRERAKALIEGGCVQVDGLVADKASRKVADASAIALTGEVCPWVSRAGLKLDHGLAHFGFDVAGRTALDIGASTGGFTEVLLSRGAAGVFAVDVGHGQLHPSLDADPRVRSMEGLNARNLSAVDLGEPIQVVTCDASFISLKLVLAPALELAEPGSLLVALIKPQFEVGRGKVGKGGVVKDEALQVAVCAEIQEWLAGQGGWRVSGVTESPLLGPEGNREFLIGAVKEGEPG